ncbi:MAG: molybdenum cofactor guanylyltransferase [Desulfobacterales bacterium]|jgi:molybdopterin-guanine dinucleotide biosynthesis protein A
MRSEACAGIILSGGLNIRMNRRNKAFLQLGDHRFLDRIVVPLRAIFSEIILVTKNVGFYEGWDLKIVKDIFDVHSPLTGIHAGLANTDSDYVFTIGCDTPFLKRAVIELLISAIEPGVDIIVPASGSYFQPLCAVYSQKCKAIIEKQLRAGDIKVDRFFDKVIVKKIPYEKFKTVDPDLLSFFNVNTPEDFQKAEALLAK